METWNSVETSRAAVSDSFAETLKAVANGRRLELLEHMAQGEHSVESLARLTGMAVTTTSAHLQTLNRAGLVSRRREGTTIYYQLSGDDVAELYTAAKRVAMNRNPRLRETLDAHWGDEVGNVPVVDTERVVPSSLVIDVRPVDEYESGHFPGALSFPLDELESRITEIPADTEIVIYCRGELCRTAREAAALLRGHGLDAKALAVGIVEWRADKEITLEVA